MLGTVLRSRAFASTRLLTRFTPRTFVAVRPQLSSIPRTFTSSSVSRESEHGEASAPSNIETRTTRSDEKSRLRNTPSNTIWIGNLPFSAVKRQLEDLFSDFGTITSIRMAIFPSGESKGFAHIDFNDVASAQKAMDAYEESQFYLDGRPLYLDFAARAMRDSQPPSPTLYFGNYDGDEGLLQEVLADFKDVIHAIRIVRNPQTSASSRYGFIELATVEDATTVLNKFDGKEISYGQKLELSYAKPRNEALRAARDGRGPYRRREYGDRFGDRRGSYRSNDWQGAIHDGANEGGYRSRGNFRPRDDFGDDSNRFDYGRSRIRGSEEGSYQEPNRRRGEGAYRGQSYAGDQRGDFGGGDGY